MKVSFGHMAITVSDMAKSLDFYTRGLGFEKAFEINEPETGEPWIVYLHISGGQFIELFYGGQKANPWSPELRGFNHLCIAVDDMQTYAKEIQERGIVLDKQPKQGCDNNWQCWITDPDGVRVEIMQIEKNSPHGKYVFA